MQEHLVTERKERPVSMNAFELISRSPSFNLENLFEKQMVGIVWFLFFLVLNISIWNWYVTLWRVKYPFCAAFVPWDLTLTSQKHIAVISHRPDCHEMQLTIVDHLTLFLKADGIFCADLRHICSYLLLSADDPQFWFKFVGSCEERNPFHFPVLCKWNCV